MIVLKDFKPLAERSKASQNKEELAEMLKLVNRIDPKVIVEVGSHHGHMLDTLYQAFEPDLLVGIENDEGSINELNARCARGELTYPKAGYTNPFLLMMDSQSVKSREYLKRELMGRPIDFLFIDGNHRFGAVISDYLMYAPFVRAGGIIAFHDSMLPDNNTVEVNFALAYLIETGLIAPDCERVDIQRDGGTGVTLVYV